MKFTSLWWKDHSVYNYTGWSWIAFDESYLKKKKKKSINSIDCNVIWIRTILNAIRRKKKNQLFLLVCLRRAFALPEGNINISETQTIKKK